MTDPRWYEAYDADGDAATGQSWASDFVDACTSLTLANAAPEWDYRSDYPEPTDPLWIVCAYAAQLTADHDPTSTWTVAIDAGDAANLHNEFDGEQWSDSFASMSQPWWYTYDTDTAGADTSWHANLEDACRTHVTSANLATLLGSTPADPFQAVCFEVGIRSQWPFPYTTGWADELLPLCTGEFATLDAGDVEADPLWLVCYLAELNSFREGSGAVPLTAAEASGWPAGLAESWDYLSAFDLSAWLDRWGDDTDWLLSSYAAVSAGDLETFCADRAPIDGAPIETVAEALCRAADIIASTESDSTTDPITIRHPDGYADVVRDCKTTIPAFSTFKEVMEYRHSLLPEGLRENVTVEAMEAAHAADMAEFTTDAKRAAWAKWRACLEAELANRGEVLELWWGHANAFQLTRGNLVVSGGKVQDFAATNTDYYETGESITGQFDNTWMRLPGNVAYPLPSLTETGSDVGSDADGVFTGISPKYSAGVREVKYLPCSAVDAEIAIAKGAILPPMIRALDNQWTDSAGIARAASSGDCVYRYTALKPITTYWTLPHESATASTDDDTVSCTDCVYSAYHMKRTLWLMLTYTTLGDNLEAVHGWSDRPKSSEHESGYALDLMIDYGSGGQVPDANGTVGSNVYGGISETEREGGNALRNYLVENRLQYDWNGLIWWHHSYGYTNAGCGGNAVPQLDVKTALTDLAAAAGSHANFANQRMIPGPDAGRDASSDRTSFIEQFVYSELLAKLGSGEYHLSDTDTFYSPNNFELAGDMHIGARYSSGAHDWYDRNQAHDNHPHLDAPLINPPQAGSSYGRYGGTPGTSLSCADWLDPTNTGDVTLSAPIEPATATLDPDLTSDYGVDDAKNGALALEDFRRRLGACSMNNRTNPYVYYGVRVIDDNTILVRKDASGAAVGGASADRADEFLKAANAAATPYTDDWLRPEWVVEHDGQGNVTSIRTSDWFNEQVFGEDLAEDLAAENIWYMPAPEQACDPDLWQGVSTIGSGDRDTVRDALGGDCSRLPNDSKVICPSS
ncbi:MAG: hypothetical protein IT198_01745 [Acidimicrobiia bacterium]|nr:hypothetical protein [Acidimicrobiia bacterium]